MNDLVVLPVVLVLIAVATDQGNGAGGWSVFLTKLLVLGPVIGFAIGGLGYWLISWMDAKTAIRRGIGRGSAEPVPLRLLPGIR